MSVSKLNLASERSRGAKNFFTKKYEKCRYDRIYFEAKYITAHLEKQKTLIISAVNEAEILLAEMAVSRAEINLKRRMEQLENCEETVRSQKSKLQKLRESREQELKSTLQSFKMAEPLQHTPDVLSEPPPSEKETPVSEPSVTPLKGKEREEPPYQASPFDTQKDNTNDADLETNCLTNNSAERQLEEFLEQLGQLQNYSRCSESLAKQLKDRVIHKLRKCNTSEMENVVTSANKLLHLLDDCAKEIKDHEAQMLKLKKRKLQ